MCVLDMCLSIAEFEVGQTVLECLLAEYRQVRDALRRAEEVVAERHSENGGRALVQYQHARDAYDHLGGDSYESKAYKMLDGLGLAGRRDQQVASLSGGEKKRVGSDESVVG